MSAAENLQKRYRHLQTPPKVGGPADDLEAKGDKNGKFLTLGERYRKG